MVSQTSGHLLAVVVPFGIWTMLVLFLLALLLAVEEGIQNLRRLHQIPCHRCQYYTGSHYLKCPVHPIRALSEEAIGCHDYALCDVALKRRSRRSANAMMRFRKWLLRKALTPDLSRP